MKCKKCECRNIIYIYDGHYTSQSGYDRAQDSLAPGEDNQAIRENAGWSWSPRAQVSLLLMLGADQHGGRYDPSTVKRRKRERERTVCQ